MAIAIGDIAIERFRSALRGTVIVEGDDAFEDARAVFNAAIDKRPAFVVRCADAADVARSIESHARVSSQWRCAAAGTASPGTLLSTVVWSSISAS